jgi:hypothetical protein
MNKKDTEKVKRLEKRLESIRGEYEGLGKEIVNIRWANCLDCIHFRRDRYKSTEASCANQTAKINRCVWNPENEDQRVIGTKIYDESSKRKKEE